MGDVGGARPATFGSVLAVAEFRALWSAEVLSLVGDQLARVAISVLVFERTNSAGLTALTYALTYLPDLIGGPLLAGIADRLPRRPVMLTCDLLRAALVALMAIPGTPLALVACLLVLVQLCNAPFAAAQAATLPLVLDGDRYVVGQTVRHVSIQTANVIGFALGGGLVAVLGVSQALLLDAATFVLSALLVRLGVAARPLVARADGTRERWAQQITGGVRLIAGDPRLRSLLLLAWLAGFYIVPEGLAVPYAAEIGAGTAAIGLLLAALPAGYVVGAAALARLTAPETRLRLLGPLALLTMAPLVVFAWRPGLVTAVALLAFTGVAAAYQVTAAATFMQSVPDGRRGQAYGLAGSGLVAVQGLGLAGGGVVAAIVGSSAATIAIAGCAGLLAAALAAWSWERNRAADAGTSAVKVDDALTR